MMPLAIYLFVYLVFGEMILYCFCFSLTIYHLNVPRKLEKTEKKKRVHAEKQTLLVSGK